MKSSREEIGIESGSGPLDRSKVRILLCENDVKSSKEVFELLCKCSYQVTAVRTPRQVIDALNAEGPDIDIILTEVDLPVAKGLKMLKYIMRDVELRRIPIIMMSAQDEVSVVVKCLKLGAADYLVKPLRTNELLNLWTHMWRRRRMLGLVEKKILNSDFDMVASDPSDANTNSTTQFSDDTDDKSRRSNVPTNSTSNYLEDESNIAASLKPPFSSSSEYPRDNLRPNDRMAQLSLGPKKSELKIGHSSAFFTYVKSSIPPSKCQRIECLDGSSAKLEHSNREETFQTLCQPEGIDGQQGRIRGAWENYYNGNGFPSGNTGIDPCYAERSCTPRHLEVPHVVHSKEQLPTVLMHPSYEAQFNVSGHPTLAPFPYYMSGIMNQVMMPPPRQQYQGNQHGFSDHATSSILPQFNSVPQFPPHGPMMSAFPYYPANMCMQPGKMPTSHFWPSVSNSSSTQVKPTQVERRDAALIKFRQKRKDRCFDKKIRYINRKRLAERRPRLRGQFVRPINGIDVDFSDQQINVEDSDEDEEEAELESREYPREDYA